MPVNAYSPMSRVKLFSKKIKVYMLSNISVAAAAKSLQSCPTVQPHRLQPMLGVKLGYLFDFSLGH